MIGQHQATALQALVCRICGESAEERRKEVKAGECSIPADYGHQQDKCLMNSTQEAARAQ